MQKLGPDFTPQLSDYEPYLIDMGSVDDISELLGCANHGYRAFEWPDGRLFLDHVAQDGAPTHKCVVYLPIEPEIW